MSALAKIRAAGFTLVLDGYDLVVEPFSELTPPQVLFLKSHKAEIIEELKAGQLVTCYTPTGNPIRVQATSAAHADFIRIMNPKPPDNPVRITKHEQH